MFKPNPNKVLTTSRIKALTFAIPLSLVTIQSAPASAAEGYFCADYNECREIFQSTAAAKAIDSSEARTWTENLPGSPDQDLQVRFGFFPSGQSGPKKLLIMSSGIHGLEGYTGSAVQSLFLNEIMPYAHHQNIDVLMINGINAYGMKNQRRHTSNRVDLNRNWFADDEFPKTIDDSIYDDFYNVFNPESKATFSTLDFAEFLTTKLASNLSAVMSGDLTKAAGQGQYRFPNGLSFGGTKSEPHRKLITDVLDQLVPNYQHVLAMDLHTGLGRRELQLLPNPPYSARAGKLRKEIFEVNWPFESCAILQFEMLFYPVELIFSQRARKFTVVERRAGVIPPAWFNLTRFHGVFAPNHAWRGFVVPGPTRKRTCPAHDEPNDSDPTPTGKPSTGRAPAEFWIPWADLLRKTVGFDPEICVCGARMIVDDAITDGEKIAETLARLGRRSARCNGSTQETAINWRARLCV